MVLLIGLAVGVDYSMFYLKREREERAAGRSERGGARGRRGDLRPLGAHLRADRDRRDGRHVPDRRPDLRVVRRRRRSLVVAVAVLGSLTVLPALLSRLGDNVDRLRVPFVGRLAATTARAGSGARSSTASCAGRSVGRSRRRGAARARAAGAPAPHGDAGPRHVPAVARRRARRTTGCSRRSPGTALPANVVVKAPNVKHAGGAERRSRQLEQRALASGRMHEPITVDVNSDATVANITDPDRRATATDAASNAALAALRDEIVPETVGASPGRRGRRHRADGRSGRTQTDAAEVEPAARGRVRARCSRSC